MNKCKLPECKNKAKRIFCSRSCSSKYHNRLWNSRTEFGSYGRVVTKKYCIGINCRGEKTFMSQGKYDRVCQACQNVQNGFDNGYAFNTIRRGTKAG